MVPALVCSVLRRLPGQAEKAREEEIMWCIGMSFGAMATMAVLGTACLADADDLPPPTEPGQVMAADTPEGTRGIDWIPPLPPQPSNPPRPLFGDDLGDLGELDSQVYERPAEAKGEKTHRDVAAPRAVEARRD